jgi:hypothetical protein
MRRNIMSYNNSPYDSIGVAIIGELFKQAEEIIPISDEPTKPSLLQRVFAALKADKRAVEQTPCDEERSAQSPA